MSLFNDQNQLGFDYVLHKEKIAQWPIELAVSGCARSDAKLLCFENKAEIIQRKFSDLPALLRTDDLLILNNSKVIPSRFFVNLSGREIEIILVEKARHVSDKEETWLALAKPMRHLKLGNIVTLSDDLKAEIIGRKEERFLELRLSSLEKTVSENIQKSGLMPIPPYIRGGKSDESDRETYQTIYSSVTGSVAAPTAGLHFTSEIFSKLKSKNINFEFVTLHVGAGSFLPVEDGKEFAMRGEIFSISSEVWNKIIEYKKQGKRIVAVGTTTVRALESAANMENFTSDAQVTAKLFIQPGYKFKIVDALVTNFHQPRSTHLLLVSAFCGVENVKKMYEYALENEFRFLSYGDAMFIG